MVAGGRLHRPPTSLDTIPIYSPGMDATINGQYPDDISKIVGLPFLAAHDSLPQPGRVTEKHTPETAAAESDTEGELSVEEAPNVGLEPCDGLIG